ncbi:hypothetical protein [Bacillus sp. B15-48]|uniref:hypothetical protein n=1 Tax=Bacillus sp. B15-48 TaxID=1548601 RepID=UPI00193F8992|nr:hypothetical protein [Bacillus sp. B15-48]
MGVLTEKVSNMPDILFAKLCDEKYKINKGVLNVIDLWFYKRGVNEITARRKTILSFIDYIHITENNGGKVKFGPGGLAVKLEIFWQQQGERFKKVVSHAGK